jgi:hypothetical protein
MSEATSGISCPNGEIPAQPPQGGTYFFTVTLAERQSKALVDQIGALRAAFRVAKRERPFIIDAIVVLPDHLHVILTLPQGDADFAGDGGASKDTSAPNCLPRGSLSGVMRMANLHFGKDVTGSTLSVTSKILSVTWITFITIL